MSGYERVTVTFPSPDSSLTDVWVQDEDTVRRYKVEGDGTLTRMHACAKPDPAEFEGSEWTCPDCGLVWQRHVEAWWGLPIPD